MRVRSVLLANCGTLQGGVQLIPTALFDDGQMDIVLLSPRNPLDWARIVAKTVLRWGEDIPVMTVKQSPSCTVEMDEPLMFQIDGDAVGDVIGVKARVSLHR
ncbi:hypothetical protein [Nesterenkonia pannonica]|uniref:diacylglycerol/lipid kinase family protein n=1 Tax=Nesterenkonia pannonica TaxID=1548602 RepID=UPI002164B97D|nr:hypothetical protein [Nesterenkonia pannonica]